MVAQYGEEKHLVGVSAGSINHLAKIENLSNKEPESLTKTVEDH
jgi:hypothetical protein